MAAFQAGLTICSLYKITTGNVGSWVVTQRKAQKPKIETYEVEDEESIHSSEIMLLRVPLASGDEAPFEEVITPTACDTDGL